MAVPRIMKGSKDLNKGVMIWAIKNGVFIIIFAAIIMLGSGRLDWAMGWAMVAFLALYIALMGIILYWIDPSLLAERSGYQKGAKKWDLVIASTIAIWLPMAIYIIAALNKRYGWTPEIALWLQIAGFALMTIGYLLILWAMTTNRYFSAVIRIQDDRGHHVISTGPYRFVRHPGYVSVALVYPGIALALGSAWALIPAALIIFLTVIRTALEDQTLQKELPGYKEYTNKVKYRLIPGVW